MWSSHRVARADAFLRQAESDLRTAQALSVRPLPLDPRDLPAQVLAKLAQAVEKSLKGYLFLFKNEVELTHRIDKFLRVLLDRNLDFADPAHHAVLARLFSIEAKEVIRHLVALTPGTQGRGNVPNTEYPWTDSEGVVAPFGSSVLARVPLAAYQKQAGLIVWGLRKLWSEYSRRPVPVPKTLPAPAYAFVPAP
ncbi:MAG TPA: hypothetical protein PKE31_16340 [Pseudomonadota bacterium]|nr:hypothetical protein [Pseudomonadota bacterium]